MKPQREIPENAKRPAGRSPDADEGEIALMVHRGTAGAVERLVRKYQDQLYGYAVQLLRDRFDAQEVTQDAFVRACRSLMGRYDEARCRALALRPWLFRITRNLARNRRRARLAQREDTLERGKEPVGIAPVRPLQEQFEVRQRLGVALTGLAPVMRELIWLRFFEGMSYSEIAGLTGASEASIRGRVFRGLRAMRALLAELE